MSQAPHQCSEPSVVTRTCCSVALRFAGRQIRASLASDHCRGVEAARPRCGAALCVSAGLLLPRQGGDRWAARGPAPAIACAKVEQQDYPRGCKQTCACALAGDIDLVIIVPEVRQEKSASEVHLAVRLKLLEKVSRAAGRVAIANLVSFSAPAEPHAKAWSPECGSAGITAGHPGGRDERAGGARGQPRRQLVRHRPPGPRHPLPPRGHQGPLLSCNATM